MKTILSEELKNFSPKAITSPDGLVSVSANNDGTASIGIITRTYDTSVNGIVDITPEQQARIDQIPLAADTGSFVSLIPDSGTGPSGYKVYAINFSEDGTQIYRGNDMGACELYPDGTIRLFSGIQELMEIFPSIPAVVGHAPAVDTATSHEIATEGYVDDKIGDIDSVLDGINGEVV